MKIIIFALAMISITNSAEISNESDYKNKASVDLDARLRYERSLGMGFHLGTVLRYILVIQGQGLVNADQRPEYWLFTFSHKSKSSFMQLENRISTISNEYYLFSVKYDFQARKRIIFEKRWAISPIIQLFEYVLETGSSGEDWSFSRMTHHAEMMTKLGMELEVGF
jgi:hypothetical protein